MSKITILLFTLLSFSLQARESYAPVISKASQSVVKIYAKSVGVETLRDPFADFFGGFFFPFSEGPKIKTQRVANGSGFFIDPDQGVMATAAHVIDGATSITVELFNNRTYGAEVLYQSKKYDVAFLKIKDNNFYAQKPIEDRLSFARNIQIGDTVFALGYPLGLEMSATKGMVSALNQGVEGLNFLQFDAAVNRGNSGGLLMDSNGDIMGVVVAMYAKGRSQGFMGIGFAVPPFVIQKLYTDRYIDKKEASWFGLNTQMPPQGFFEQMPTGYTGYGVILNRLNAKSPLKNAFQQGDLLTHVNGIVVTSPHQLKMVLGLMSAGDQITFKGWSQRHQRPINTHITAPHPEKGKELLIKSGLFAGIKVAELTAKVAQEMDMEDADGSIIITAIDRASPMGRMMSVGDRIISINGEHVTSVESVETLSAANSHHVRFAIKDRHGSISERVISFR